MHRLRNGRRSRLPSVTLGVTTPSAVPSHGTAAAVMRSVTSAPLIAGAVEVQLPIPSTFRPARRAQGLASYLLRARRNRVLTEVAALLLLAGLGLAIHHSWLTTTPLTAGDWVWVSREQAGAWFPWP